MGDLKHERKAGAADALIADLWSRWGVPNPQAHLLVDVYLSETREKHVKLSAGLRNHLRIFDQFLAWSADLSLVLNFKPIAGRDRKLMSYALLSGAITSLMFSIRHLVVSGHDVSAKHLVRSLGEHCDVLHLLITRPDLAEDFAVPNDWDASNQFWHKHVKSGRARKAEFASLDPNFSTSGFFRDWNDHRRREDLPNSLAIHPSYIASFIACYPGSYNTIERGIVNWMGYLGAVSDGSIRTLSYSVYSLLTLVCSKEFPFEGKGDLPVLAVYDRDDEFCQRVVNGRPVLVALIDFLSSKEAQLGDFAGHYPHEDDASTSEMPS